MNLLAAAVTAVAVGSWVSVPGGSWSPTNDQIASLRAEIEPFVKSQARERGLELKKWSSYSFQFQGQVEAGRNVVFVNAFCVVPPSYTSERFVLVLDGGPCFFQAKYDPLAKRFIHLAFNGVA
jgi:hypothetical protein